MLKFLRKYNTLILVLGGSLLMVVFLVPQAIEQIGQNPSNIPYARVNDQTITQQDFLDYQRSWQMVTQVAGAAVMVMQIENVDHWMLLNMEADRYGLIGGAGDGASSVPFFAQYIAQADLALEMQRNPWGIQNQEQYNAEFDRRTEQFRVEMVNTLEAQAMAGQQQNEYYRALARLRGVGRLLQTYDSLAGQSIPETQLAAIELFDRVTADVAMVPASAFRPDPSTLSQEELQAHFEQYRSVLPGEGDFGFGYLLDDAVRYEYLRVNSAAIADSLDASDADLLEYFRKNENNYFGQDFLQARASVRTDYINSLVNQRLDEISSSVQRERLRASQSLPTESNPTEQRYRVVPDDWVGPDLDVYAQVARDASGLSGQALEDLVTTSPVTDDFQTSADLNESDIRSARFRFTASEIFQFVNLPFVAKEFGGDERLDLQRGLLFGPLELFPSAGRRDLVFLRITEVREQGPPESLSEVEASVREDLATLRGYERLLDQAETFRTAFADGGFTWFNDMDFSDAEGAEQHADTVIGNGIAQSELGTNLPRIASSPLPEEVMELARTLDPTQSLDEVNPDALSVSVPMPDTLSLGLATIKAFRPTTVDRLREGMVQIQQRQRELANTFEVEAPYTFDSLSNRLGFERLDREEDEFAS